jgi:hypothetical protein
VKNSNTAAEAARTDTPVEVKADLRRFNKAEEQVAKAVTALAAVKDIKDELELASAMDTLSAAAKVDKLIEAKRVEITKPMNEEVKKVNAVAKALAAKLPPAIDAAKKEVLAYNKRKQEELKAKRRDARIPELTKFGFEFNPVLQKYVIEVDGCVTSVSHEIIESNEDKDWATYLVNILGHIDNLKKEAKARLESTSALTDAFGSDEDKSAKTEAIEKLEPVNMIPTSFSTTGSASTVKGVTKRWTFEVEDLSQVPREYLVLDSAKVRAAIAEGARTIAGIKIYQTEGLTLR